MGQYYVIANLDKQQFIHPHKFGDGLKLVEFAGSGAGVMSALAMLLATSNGRGGGDVQSKNPVVGSWRGNRIAVVGDYTKDADLPDYSEASKIFKKCEDGEFTDISDQLVPIVAKEFDVKITGDGWRDKVDV